MKIAVAGVPMSTPSSPLVVRAHPSHSKNIAFASNSDCTSSQLRLYVNGKCCVVQNPDPTMTLLRYLRDSVGLKGTKLGCGEGGCGACTVMLSYHDTTSMNIRHYSANACLTPVCSLDGIAVTTIEGIGGMNTGLHPVQERLAKLHGSQCGFCTPGIVMALYTKLRQDPNATPHEIEESLDGNLCRCTGYRPILDAARSLSNNKQVSNGGCCQGSGGVCPCMADGTPADQSVTLQHSSSEQVIDSLPGLQATMHAKGWTEPIFPPTLMNCAPRELKFEDKGLHWLQPVTLASLVQLKATHPDARLVVGNTEVGIETKFKGLDYKVFINPSYVPELQVLKMDGDSLCVGAAVTINGLKTFIDTLIAQSSEPTILSGKYSGLKAISDMLLWFASNQIRNVASVAGNIVTASPISDLNPMLIACGATLKLASISGERDVPIKDFFLAYRKVDLQQNEVVKTVSIPLCSMWEFVVPLKQARRREDDISIVTAGVRVKLQPTSNGWIVDDFCYSLGGMAPTTISAKRTRSFVIGKQWNSATVEALFPILKEEITLPDSVPGGQAEYRMSLAVSFLFRAYLAVINDLSARVAADTSGSLPAVPLVDSREKSATSGFITEEKPYSRSEQNYYAASGGLQHARPEFHAASDEVDRGPVGAPLQHKSSNAQVSGEAVYTNDVKAPGNTLHAALVTSTKAHARILGVDTSDAEICDGYIAYFCANDVTGSNHIGAVIKDEEVFATDVVKHYGAVIGVIIAETHEQAVFAARKVAVKYEDLPPIVSIEEAIAAGSFFPDTHEIISGNLASEVSSADVVVEGTGKIGGQEHFYLETNCSLAIPVEHGQMEIYSSTQNPTKTQNFCAYVTGLSAAQVVCRCKRMGGGFGGKETRSVFIACAAALSAHLLRRPVSILIERDLDMSITGQRHAFVVNYKAGCTHDGKLKFLDAHLYSNAGYSLDLSQAVMDRALFHSDNVYQWPAFRVKGTLCRTNQPTHTAFRGFGGPQGMMLTELVMSHLAKAAGLPVNQLREMNLYKEGSRTHYGQALEGFNVPKLWEQIKSSGDLESRQSAIAAFNAANKYKKRGLAVLPTKFGINFTAKFMNQGGALVHVYTDGTVLISHGGTEMGQGLHTKMIQIAAKCLGISDTKCHVMETATNAVANTSPTAASMSTDLYGMAVLDACEQIEMRLAPIRAKMVGATWETVVQTAFFERIDLSAHGYYTVPTERCGYDWTMSGITDNSLRGQPFNYFTQGVASAEVEIDCLTGDSKLLRVDIVMDVGKSINPALDIGQIEGAFIQGYGWTTMEELMWGDTQHAWVRPGQLFTRGPGTYKIPAFNDVPADFRTHLFDGENKFCVHSSKAVGEPPFFLGCAGFFAIKVITHLLSSRIRLVFLTFLTCLSFHPFLSQSYLQDAVEAARAERGLSDYCVLHAPASSERIRMACADHITALVGAGPSYTPKGSW